MRLLSILLVVLSILALTMAEFHRFCGDHGDCKHVDKNHPTECCMKGPLNGYHECLDNPNPSQRCPALPTFGNAAAADDQ